MLHDQTNSYSVNVSSWSFSSWPVLGGGISTVAVDFIRDNAEAIMRLSPISYVKDAELRGSLFDPEDKVGVISFVYTKLFVDHTEPLEALSWVREGLDWSLGESIDAINRKGLGLRREHTCRPLKSLETKLSSSTLLTLSTPSSEHAFAM